MRKLLLAALLILAPLRARAAAPLYTGISQPSGGTVTQYLSGNFCVAASSASAGTCATKISGASQNFYALSSAGPTNYVLRVDSQSATAMFVLEGNGNLGIGTGAPQTLLDVNGNAQFGSGVNKSTFSTTGSLALAPNASLTLSGANGNVTTASSVTASAFFGDASHLTGGGVLGGGTPNYIPHWSASNALSAAGTFDDSGSSATAHGPLLAQSSVTVGPTSYGAVETDASVLIGGFSLVASTFTGAVNASTFTVTNSSGASYYLVVTATVTTGSSVDLFLTFNGDNATASYQTVWREDNIAANNANQTSSVSGIQLVANGNHISATSVVKGHIYIDIGDNTDQPTIRSDVTVRNEPSGTFAHIYNGGLWKSSAAVASITVKLSAGTAVYKMFLFKINKPNGL